MRGLLRRAKMMVGMRLTVARTPLRPRSSAMMAALSSCVQSRMKQ